MLLDDPTRQSVVDSIELQQLPHNPALSNSTGRSNAPSKAEAAFAIHCKPSQSTASSWFNSGIGRRNTRQDVIQAFWEVVWLRKRWRGERNDVRAIQILWPVCKDVWN
jgi:hypothetical protein